MPRMRMQVIDKLESKHIPEPNTGCWLWTDALDDDGYGSVMVDRKRLRAHRVSYEHHRGLIPEGLTLDHLCRTRSCINPDHLEAVSNRVNVLRGVGPCAQNARKAACPKGHPYDGPNLYAWEGQRYCRACHREAHRRWKAKKRAERAP